MIKKDYPEGEVFCAVCFKLLTDNEDKERGFHRHCKARGSFTDDEMSDIFCKDQK